jgi:hypothetical protein
MGAAPRPDPQEHGSPGSCASPADSPSNVHPHGLDLQALNRGNLVERQEPVESSPTWRWDRASKTYGNFGNANQWTVNAGLGSLAREAAQNSNDASQGQAELRFTVISLTGEHRRRFEEAIGWTKSLRPHLEAMAEQEQVMTRVIRDGLAHEDATGELLLLRIEDRGCVGLDGPEFPEDDLDPADYGNFIKLCRLDLFSGKAEASGGSFGLGKAVYWRFSRFQTALFHSLPSRAWGGADASARLFGVNQGTDHRVDEKRYLGRGYFGVPDRDGQPVSSLRTHELVDQLHLERPEGVPGTSVLIVGFFDPDNPDADLEQLANGIEAGIEENFWPLMTWGGMEFHVAAERNGQPIRRDAVVQPKSSFPELCKALKTYDDKNAVAELQQPGDVVVRDVQIRVPSRKTDPKHPAFVHTAKLVVTLSDEDPDSLENKVCLFRGPGMVVEHLERSFPSTTYHAFLLAGEAVNRSNPSTEMSRADDFLRFAEPPAHDMWIPRRNGPAQTSLGANYSTPFRQPLEEIRLQVFTHLRSLFDTAPASGDRIPAALLKHFRFLNQGGGDHGPRRRPDLELDSWMIVDGAWVVQVTATMKNRSEGWSFEPLLQFVGLEGRGAAVRWQELEPLEGCTVSDGRVSVAGRSSGRVARAVFVGRSDPTSHPIPAERSAIDIAVRAPAPAEGNY